MSLKGIKTIMGIAGVVCVYAIYCITHPGADGAVFASVCALIGAMAGYGVRGEMARKGPKIVFNGSEE